MELDDEVDNVSLFLVTNSVTSKKLPKMISL